MKFLKNTDTKFIAVNYYLIRFKWGTFLEDAHETVLVEETSFDDACEKIQEKYHNAREFENLTL